MGMWRGYEYITSIGKREIRNKINPAGKKVLLYPVEDDCFE
jgi:hypothetical protein